MTPSETHVPGLTVLPPAGREEQLERWGLSRSHRYGEAARRPRRDEHEHTDEHDDVYADRELEELGFLQDGGWTAIDSTRGKARTGSTPGARDAGMRSHRGVLHPDEHVDADALRSAVEHELGFSFDDVQAVYRQGKKSPDQLELRARIDARLLGLSVSGANMAALGRVLGFKTTNDTTPRAIKNALARAREENA